MCQTNSNMLSSMRVLLVLITLFLISLLSSCSSRNIRAQDPTLLSYPGYPLEVAPSIHIQPENITVRLGRTLTDGVWLRGDSAILTVAALGNPTPKYQWRKNGIDIAGANSPTLYIREVKPSDEGKYDVVASNHLGSAMSRTVTFNVVEATGAIYVVRPGDDLRSTVANLKAGETILFRGGVYDLSEYQNMMFKNTTYKGISWSSPLTFSAYPGEIPIFDSSHVLKADGNWKKLYDNVYSLDLENIGISPPDPNYLNQYREFGWGKAYFYILWIDGIPGIGQPIAHQLGLDRSMAEQWLLKKQIDRAVRNEGSQIHAVDKPGEFTYDPMTHMLYIWLPDGSNPNNHVIRYPFYPREKGNRIDPEGAMGIWIKRGNQYLIFRGLHFRGTTEAPIYFKDSNHVLFEDLDISYHGGQLYARGHDITIIKSHIHHGAYNGIQTWHSTGGLTGIRFLQNEVHHMGDSKTWGHYKLGAESWGMNITSTDRAIIRNNYFHHIRHGAKLSEGGGIVHETWGKDRQQQAAHHNVYEKNVFANCADGIHFQSKRFTRLYNAVIRKNLFYNIRRAIFAWGDNQGHIVHNNTIYNSTQCGIHFNNAVKNSNVRPSKNSIFRNRLIRSNGRASACIHAAVGNQVMDNSFETGVFSLDELQHQIKQLP